MRLVATQNQTTKLLPRQFGTCKFYVKILLIGIWNIHKKINEK